MLWALLIVLGILGGWTLWLYRRLVVAVGLVGPVRWLVVGLLVGGWALFLFCLLSRDREPIWWLNWIGLTWLALIWYVTLFVALLALAGLVVRLARGRPARERVLRIGTPIALLLAMVVTGYGIDEAADPQVEEQTVRVDDLPPHLDGLRIAVITDLHVGPVRDAEFTRTVVQRTNAAKPDVVLLVGDLADGTVRTVGETLDPLSRLRAPMGVFAATGNHEYISGEPDSWVEHWRSLGITPLRNRSTVVDGLTLAGVEDRDAGRTDGQGRPADLGAALKGVSQDDTTVLLSHQPAMVGEMTTAQRDAVDLQVSGHTHGGQLFPFGLLVGLQQPVVSGLGESEGVQILTSRGAGAWGPPVRVLAPPEIPVITLRRG